MRTYEQKKKTECSEPGRRRSPKSPERIMQKYDSGLDLNERMDRKRWKIPESRHRMGVDRKERMGKCA